MQKKFIKLTLGILFFTFKAYAGIAVLNGLTHEKNIRAGGVYQGFIEVQNTDNAPIDLKIYQTDLILDSLGGKLFTAIGSFKKSNAKWVEMAAVYLTLLPKEKRTIAYEIRVPENDSLNTLVGTYWSVLMVEGVIPVDTLAKRGTLNVSTTTRYAIQIVTNIESDGVKNLEFGNIDIEKKDGKTILSVNVLNNGDFLLVPEIVLEAYDENVNSVLNQIAKPTKIYPAWNVKIEFDISSLKPGEYSSVVMADCGDDIMFGGRLNFVVKK